MTDDVSIGYDVNRRTVDKYIVIHIPNLTNQFSKSFIMKKFGRIWRYGTYRNDIYTFMYGIMTYYIADIIIVMAEIIGKTMHMMIFYQT